MSLPSLRSPQTASNDHRRGRPHSTNSGSPDWPRIWFGKLCRFHRVQCHPDWQFSREHVLAFLRDRRDADVPAWKRIKIVEGLVDFRQRHPADSIPHLTDVISTLKQIAANEEFSSGGEQVDTQPTPEELIGKIDPREIAPIQELRRKLRLLGKALNTEVAYVKRFRQFLKSKGITTLAEAAEIRTADVTAFLTDLAVDGNVAASTQDQAYYGIKFYFNHVLNREMGDVDAIRADKPRLRPTVMSSNEVGRVLNELRGDWKVIGSLLYGSGMRISEALRIRIKDLDFDQRMIIVHSSKRNKSRLVPMPESLVEALRQRVLERRTLHQRDLDDGRASVWLPHALSRKFPAAHQEFKWQFLFASARFSRNPRSRRLHRHHLHRDSFAAALRKAVLRAGVEKYITSHTFRHSFATHLLQGGTDIRTVQELLGHQDVSTTMIYTHVLFDEDCPVQSPLDRLTSPAETFTPVVKPPVEPGSQADVASADREEKVSGQNGPNAHPRPAAAPPVTSAAERSQIDESDRIGGWRRAWRAMRDRLVRRVGRLPQRRVQPSERAETECRSPCPTARGNAADGNLQVAATPGWEAWRQPGALQHRHSNQDPSPRTGVATD